MTAEDATPSKGQECTGSEQNKQNPDWETLARREMWLSLKMEGDEEMIQSFHNLSRSIKEGTESVEQLNRLRLKFLSIDERAREFLIDTDELERGDRTNTIVVAAWTVAWAAIHGREDDVARYVDRLTNIVEDKNQEE